MTRGIAHGVGVVSEWKKGTHRLARAPCGKPGSGGGVELALGLGLHKYGALAGNCSCAVEAQRC